MKVIKFIIAMILMLVIVLILSITDFTLPEEKRDYSGLTEKEWVTPLDGVFKEYFEKEWEEYEKTHIRENMK